MAKGFKTGGRKKGSVNKRVGLLREQAQCYTEEALQVLASLLKSESETSRFNAAQALLDRGWGRPSQAIVGDESQDPVKVATSIVLNANLC